MPKLPRGAAPMLLRHLQREAGALAAPVNGNTDTTTNGSAWNQRLVTRHDSLEDWPAGSDTTKQHHYVSSTLTNDSKAASAGSLDSFQASYEGHVD